MDKNDIFIHFVDDVVELQKKHPNEAKILTRLFVFVSD